MDLQKLENAITFIEQNFGMDWLKDRVEELKELDPERTTTGRYINLWETGVCPVALMWFKCREQLAFHYLNGQLKASADALLLLRLVDDMSTVENSTGFQMRFECLKDASQYHRAAYEMHIAAGYVGLGQTVSFTQTPGVFRVIESESTVVSFIDTGSNGNIDYHQMFQSLPEVGSNSISFYYIDCSMAPGEFPEEGLKHRRQLLKEKVPGSKPDNIILTTTVFGKEPRGYFMIEKSLALWEEDKDFKIFLPDTERR